MIFYIFTGNLILSNIENFASVIWSLELVSRSLFIFSNINYKMVLKLVSQIH